MNTLKSFFFPQNLRDRLVMWFLLISLFPLGWITFISYEFSKEMLINQATANLKAVSTRQSQIIENYFRERQRNSVSFIRDPTIIQVVEELGPILSHQGKNSPEYQASIEKLRTLIALMAQAYDYKNLVIVDKEGKILFSLLPSPIIGANLVTEETPYSSLRNLFEDTKNFIEVQVSNFTYYDSHELPASFVAAPILNPSFIGAVFAQIDNSSIYRLLTDYSGLGETGETMLVTKMDDKLVIIAPLRHQQNLNPIQIISSSTPFTQFISQILDGKRLVDTLMDYKDQESLMVGRYFLPTLGWGIITKINEAELLAPINKLQVLSFLMALTTAAIVILTASSVSRAIAYPILALTRKTKLMAAGDLSQRIEIESNDEIGRLGQSFNDMATQLDTMVKHLDNIVAKRTQEVETQNLQLEHTIEELQQAQDRLVNQEKLASLGALTAGIAHEIKNPLNFINNFAELSLHVDQDLQEHLEKIKSKVPPDEVQDLQDSINMLKLNISKIYEHGKRADGIVRNMLQHSRGTPGEKTAIDINVLLDEYVTLSYHGMRAQDSTFNVKLEKNYDKTLPKIPVVPQELSRVFLNLLNNAYYSVNQKKKQLGDAYFPIVRITTQNYNEWVSIKIWDNGLGISNEVFPKLFNPFFTTKPPGEGTGLGLSLSYNIIVQGHNGTLIADSEPGEFAEFVIHLPLKSKHY